MGLTCAIISVIADKTCNKISPYAKLEEKKDGLDIYKIVGKFEAISRFQGEIIQFITLYVRIQKKGKK